MICSALVHWYTSESKIKKNTEVLSIKKRSGDKWTHAKLQAKRFHMNFQWRQLVKKKQICDPQDISEYLGPVWDKFGPGGQI